MVRPSERQAFEERVARRGSQLLADAHRAAGQLSSADSWIQELLQRLNRDSGFRVQALRFIDVLPSLEDDAELVCLFNEYFTDQDFPLPRLGGAALKAGRLLGNRALAVLIRSAAGLLSRRFMAGEDVDEVFARSASLVAGGRLVSLDRVGEVTLSEAEADRYLQAYLELLDAAGTTLDRPLQLSVKLSSLIARNTPQGLAYASEVVYRRLQILTRRAREHGAGITLDMEDYDRRPLVLMVFERWMLDPEFQDWADGGLAVQAYLREAEADVRWLMALAERRSASFHVRLVRGAYWDQECIVAAQHGWPVPVWQHKAETDHNFEVCLDRLLAAHPRIRTAVATHNPRSLAYAMARTEQLGLDTDQIEFQMLFGMADALQDAVQASGHPLRVYLPFGEPIPGMAYLVRRLLENSSSQSLARWFDTPSTNDGDLLRSPAVDDDAPPTISDEGFANEPMRRFVADGERTSFAQAIERVRGLLGQEYAPLIGARRTDGGTLITSICPADPGMTVGHVVAAGRAEADRAIALAGREFATWRDRPVGERTALLRETARLLRDRRDQFAAWQIFEAGKNWSEADADVCEAIDFLMYYAAEAERLAQAGGVSVPGEANRYFYQPRGIGVVIPPWNFPLAILTGMLSATLVAGNCAILKPSSDTPVIAARFVELLLEAGIPPAVVAYLPGAGRDVGEYLVDHPATHLVAFTGSREVGCRLLQRAALVQPGQHHIKRVIAEMGGKNAVVVDASADPDEAVTGVLQSAFGFQGQKCSACSRVIVVGSLYDDFVRRLADAAADLQITLPWIPHCDLGPVINQTAQQRIEAVIAAADGVGTLVYRGQRPTDLPGFYVPPAIFGDVDPGSTLAQDEIFGPVLGVMRARDFEHALDIANDTAYALTGGVYSRSPACLQEAAENFRVGNLYLNRGITGALVARQPFGGFRLSGIGSKAGGPDYLSQFMEPRCVTENTLRRGVAPAAE